MALTPRKILTHPAMVLVGVFSGFVIGLYAKPVGAWLYPIGSIYITFLSMCLLPILITAIIVGIAGLLRDDKTRPLFKSMTLLYFGGLILPCVVGIATAILLAPGQDLSPMAEKSIGALILDSPPVARTDAGILDFLGQIIPANPFESLSANQVMSIVFLCVSLGVALGSIQKKRAEPAIQVFLAIYDSFMQLYRWAVLILAFGLMFFISGLVSQMEPQVLLALSDYVIAFYAGGAVLFVIYIVGFWLAVRGPFFKTIAKLSNPNILAFMTNNPIVALPVALDTLHKDQGIDARVPEMVVPFGIFANQHGAVFLLSLISVFLAQIYVIDLSFQDYLVIGIGSILAGATAVGGGAVLIPTVAPLLSAMGIPVSLALVVLATTDNIIGPVRTVLTLQANLTLTTLVARRGKEMPDNAPPVEASTDKS